MKNYKIILLGSILVFYHALVWAAEPIAAAIGTATSVSNPGLAQKQINASETMLPTEAARSAALKGVSEAAVQTSGIPGGDAIKFKLAKIVLTGNTAFTTQQLETIYQASLNQTITLNELLGIVDKITSYYRNAGYVLSRAILPPQTIQNGVVQIHIVEGYISTVTVSGQACRALPLIQRYAQKIENVQPLNMDLLERNLLLINDIPGIDAQAVLAPSESASGAADMNLPTQYQFAQGYIAYDNFGSRYLGPREVTMGGNVNSFFNAGDTTGAQVVFTPGSEDMRYFNLSHSEYVLTTGAQWTLGANYTKTNPGFILTPVDILGDSRSFYGTLSYPVIRSREQNLFLNGGFNYQNVNSDILDTQFYMDRIRSLNIDTHYDFIDRLRGINSFDIDLEHGYPILGAASNTTPHSRPDALALYTKTDANISRLQLMGQRFSILLAGTGQYSFNPLFASEQFSYGGPVYGRGYDPSELVGDSGMAYKAELRMDTQPGFRILRSIQYYAFYDIGVVWNIVSTSLPARASAASTGVGARMEFNSYLSGNFYLAKPLTKSVNTLIASGKNGNSLRGYFQIVANI